MVCCICRHSLFSGCSYKRSSGDPYLSISLCEDKERVADISIGDLVMRLQGFRWAIEHDRWQGRVDSIKDVFEEACSDLGKNEIDKEVVEKVWDRIAPGLASQFDSPYTVPVIAPRPLLILNGEEDPRCPIAGLDIPTSSVCKACADADCPLNFKVIAQAGVGHQMTPLMVNEASNWFDRLLKV
ncbi:hypothetical protein AABB24_009644 [Solanum stoloniferum]|uniref:Uncharacterized protein n=1 Tax=Solanum stoloniferum TaxID=62892 RepID=A0ABD2UJG0_9SOLN